MNKLITVLMSLTLLFVTSCASKTRIISSDKGVSIYADGNYLGKGDVFYTDSKTVGSSTDITLKKEGCQSVNRSISQDGGIDAGAVVGGLFLLVPFLWVTKYKPMYNMEYVCQPN